MECEHIFDATCDIQCGTGSGFVMCNPNGEAALPDCPGDHRGCFEMLDTVVWSAFQTPEQSLS
jgi:hypothetical protein